MQKLKSLRKQRDEILKEPDADIKLKLIRELPQVHIFHAEIAITSYLRVQLWSGKTFRETAILEDEQMCNNVAEDIYFYLISTL